MNSSKTNENDLQIGKEDFLLPLQPEQHYEWLSTHFVLNSSKTAPVKTDAIQSTKNCNLRGRRVWCKRPLTEAETGREICPANTGGTVAFHDQTNDMVVRWDNGQITMHHKDALLRMAYLIGLHKTLRGHMDCLANRCNCNSRK